MQRYFFDLGSKHEFIYDYKGRECPTYEAAYQLAELMVIDLEQEGDWDGWVVAISTDTGKRLCALGVRNAEVVNQ
jgi:hypothetical protein